MPDHDPDDRSGEAFRRAADDSLRGDYDPPLSLSEYVDRALERSTVAADAASYLLAAIENSGTREVVERGERLTRYRFFDDPSNDGEHAVLGNTRALSAFVDDLRSVAGDRGNDGTIVWIDGPTATGKSEFKRCLVNGLREFSKTPAGRRYTLEWNVAGAGDERGLSYGDVGGDDAWYRSPVQTHPLSVFPEDVRDDLLAAINEGRGEAPPVDVDADLDPFSREAYDHLERRYRDDGRRDPFSAVTDPQHLRVTSYVVDEGRGIGVLHAEDDGTPKERLVGSWMAGMLRELDSRGRKNPQAFSYDGVLSQGNGLVSVVEDASQHADLLRRLLNVPDERRVKLDRGIGMDLDTLLVVISNPDLDAELDKFADRDEGDPLKALKRRLTRHEFGYLTNHRLEAELLHRELTGETGVRAVEAAEFNGTDRVARPGNRTDSADGTENSDADDVPDAEVSKADVPHADVPEDDVPEDDVPDVDRTRDPVRLSVRDGRGNRREWELAPHALGAAALFTVLTRLDAEELPPGIDLLDKAALLGGEPIRIDGERRTVESFDFEGGVDGETGIPVTYTRDVIADLLGTTFDRSHPELSVERVVMPADVLDAMVAGLPEAPVFSRAEAAEFDGRAPAVREAIRDRQTEAVLDAILAETGVDEATVAEYVEHVYAWDADEQVDTDRGPVDPDPLKMKVFETEALGRFDAGDYRGDRPLTPVREFRREKVIRALTRYAWENRDDRFAVDDVDLDAIPELRSVLDASDWADVRRHYPDFDPAEWENPPEGTETDRLKTETIDRLTDRGYSPASAELTTRAVMRGIRDEWGES